MCNVRAEDAGEIQFVARDVESTAYLEVEGIEHLLSFFKMNNLKISPLQI